MIEVMLFLTISSSLAVILLAGTGTAIQRQQYRDAVQSFSGFLREQYEGVISVKNDRPDSQECPLLAGTALSRGRSDCVILGRYVVSDESGDGKAYSVFPVYGLKNGLTWDYALGDKDDEYSVNWDAKTKLSNQPEENPVEISILMYRNPDNGSLTIRTSRDSYTSGSTIKHFFAGKTSSGDSDDEQLSQREICVYDTGWFSNQRQSVFLDSRANSGDAISIKNSTAEGCKDA